MPTILLLCAAPTLAAPDVRLLDAGSEPRAPLRLEVKSGHSEVVDITMVTTMDVGMGGAMRMPPMRLALRFDAEQASADTVKYTFEIIEADVESGEAALVGALRDALKPMVGFSGEATMDSRGHTSGLVMNPPPGLPKELSGNLDRSLTMVGAPLPAEPVGVGAKWTIEQDVKQEALTVRQTTTWTLVSREGPIVVLDTVVTQTAEPQAIRDPSMPLGSEVQLTSYRSEGSGQTRLDLRALAPTSSSMKMDLQMGMEAKAQGMALPMNMSMGVEMGLSKRAAGDP